MSGLVVMIWLGLSFGCKVLWMMVVGMSLLLLLLLLLFVLLIVSCALILIGFLVAVLFEFCWFIL
jgi:hypothetical protein